MASKSTDPADVTPKTITGPKDARDEKESGVDGNHYTRKTRSGHVFTLDDSKGGEHVTLQHRGGSMIQFRPDNSVQFVSHNGQYNFVFGENRIKITGAYDIVVEGSASLKVDGDYNVTVKGDVNLSAGKDFNITAQNFNQKIRGDVDVVGQNRTEKMEGNISQTAKGAQMIASKFGMSIGSSDDALALGGKTQVGIQSGGELMTKSKGKTSILSEDAIAAESKADFGIKSKAKLVLDSDGDLSIKSGGGKISSVASGINYVTGQGGSVELNGAAINLNGAAGTTDDPIDVDDVKEKLKQAAPPVTKPQGQGGIGHA
ncbi:hypothetical protein EB001_09085 [bacterium]|nr:hypothetical protein [bacterium]